MNLFCDLSRYVPGGADMAGWSRIWRTAATMMIHPGWHAAFNLRLAQMFYRCRLYPFSWLVYRWNMFVFGIDIPPAVRIGPMLWIPHPVGIVIARDASIGAWCTIYQNVTVGGRGNPPSIGNNVMLGAGSCVLGGISIGAGVKVGANAVVVDSFGDNLKLGGVPAKVLN